MWELSWWILEILENSQPHWQRWVLSGHGCATVACGCTSACSSCLSPHTPLPGGLPADSYPALCPGQIQRRRGNYTIWIWWNKDIEQNVTGILMAQQPSHSCHAHTQQKLWHSEAGGMNLSLYWQGKNWVNEQVLLGPVSEGRWNSVVSSIQSCWLRTQLFAILT